jgi:hypothetical protein
MTDRSLTGSQKLNLTVSRYVQYRAWGCDFMITRYHFSLNQQDHSWIIWMPFGFTLGGHGMSTGNLNPKHCRFVLYIVGLSFLPSQRQSVRHDRDKLYVCFIKITPMSVLGS